jgi:hypothetical protein
MSRQTTTPDHPAAAALRRALHETLIEGAREPLADLVRHAPTLIADWLFETVIRHVGADPVGALVHHPDVSAEKLATLLVLAEEGALPSYTIAYLGGSPHAPPWMAERIAYIGDVHARRAVAASAAAPASVLGRLAGDAEGYVREAVAENKQTPEETLVRLTRDESGLIREAVAENPAAPGEAIDILVTDLDLDVRRKAERHLRAPPADRRRALLLATEHGRRLLRAEDPEATVAELSALAAEEDPGVREAVAANPAFLPGDDLLARLSASPVVAARMFVGGHRGTLPALFERLSRDEEVRVRGMVASNAAAPPGVLSKLADDPTTPPDALARLVTHASSFVRDRVARNPRTPPACLDRLAHGGGTARSVAENPNTPIDVMLAITQLAEGPRLLAWVALAKRDDLPWLVVERLIQNRLAVQVHRYLFARASLPLPAGALEAMARSSLVCERRFAARHPEMPLPLLERLAGDGDPAVRWDITKSPAVPRALADRIGFAFVASAAAEAGMLGRVVALACPRADPPPDLAQAALASSCWLERYALASSPLAPASSLARLADDPDPLVRCAAARAG